MELRAPKGRSEERENGEHRKGREEVRKTGRQEARKQGSKEERRKGRKEEKERKGKCGHSFNAQRPARNANWSTVQNDSSTRVPP